MNKKVVELYKSNNCPLTSSKHYRRFKDIKKSSFKRSKDIQDKENGPDRSVSNNKFSSVP